MKLVICFFTCAVSLKLPSLNIPCDRQGLTAEAILRRKYEELGLGANLSIYEGVELTGEGQQQYKKYAANGESCTDNWGIKLENEVVNLPLIKKQSASSSSCSWPLYDAYGLNLYKFMVTNGLGDNFLQGKQVLEVGCGRGRGAAFLAQNFAPSSYLGVDLNDERIKLAKTVYGDTPNLEYRIGNAQELPISTSSLDVVLNVESSFHYPDFDKFISEVFRVLKPNGVFLWTSPLINRGDTTEKKEHIFERMGFKLIKSMDIAKDVVRARSDHLQQCDTNELEYLCSSLTDTDSYWGWMALPGSPAFKALDDGTTPYLRIIAQKI